LVLTIAVYGVVAGIVKMDDVGLHLTRTGLRSARTVGRGLVAGMPKLLTLLSAVGTVAMLWVGGHILLVGADQLGWHAPYGVVHHAEDGVRHLVASVGGVLAWLVNTGLSAVVGSAVGAVFLVLLLPVRLLRRASSSSTSSSSKR
jgi:predicted DNA repair protein MutK